MTEKHVINAMCKSLRASGLRQKEAHAILNVVQKWIKSNGIEWTNSRLKELHQWYLSYLGEPCPQIPAWWKHDKHGLPKGPFKVVFQMHNHQRALAVLSIHTAFISQDLLASQLKKLEKGLNGNGHTSLSDPLIKVIEEFDPKHVCDMHWWKKRPKMQIKRLEVPNFSILTGDSIPLGKTTIQMKEKTSISDMVEAYVSSWTHLPFCTVEYLYLLGQEHQLPPVFDNLKDFLEEEKASGKSFSQALEAAAHNKLQVNTWLSADDFAGRLSALEQESLKVRWIANPNRVTQSYLSQVLGYQWYRDLRKLPTDCTYNQSKAISWAQGKLRDGVILHSSDLTSATDLLSREDSIYLVEYFYHGIKLPEKVFNPDLSFESVEHWREEVKDHASAAWFGALRHFNRVAGADWWFGSENRSISWKQGQPLGTEPSFALLGLTNNAIGLIACDSYNRSHKDSRVNPLDSFRVVGDDIIMDNRITENYESLLNLLGGEINPSKCITSDKLAEIAGWIVERGQTSLKRVKAKNPSENNFIELYDRLGPQSRSLFLPNQKKDIDVFKYIPGYQEMVPGPYAKNSYGAKLIDRYQWYLQEVEPRFKDQLQPDFMVKNADQFRNFILMTLASQSGPHDKKHLDTGFSSRLRTLLPRDLVSDFQSEIPSKTKRNGDPRSTDGKTLRSKLDEIRSNPDFKPFSSLSAQSTGGLPPMEGPTGQSNQSPNTRRSHTNLDDWDFGY